MVLYPKSFLIDDAAKRNIMDLISELPNRNDIHHKQELKAVPVEKRVKYYENQLLLETKGFCRTMLKNIGADVERFEAILRDGEINVLFGIIEAYQTKFFKHLIGYDLKRFSLYKGHMEVEIAKAANVAEIMYSMKKYNVKGKLLSKLTEEYNLVKESFL